MSPRGFGKRWERRFFDLARRWEAAWRFRAWQELREHQRQRRTRPLAERLRGLLLSWPGLHSEWPLPYSSKEVGNWAACEEREHAGGDGQYGAREAELVRVLGKTLSADRRARRRRVPQSLEEVAGRVQHAARSGIKSPVEQICSIVERGRDAAWRDRQRIRATIQLRESAKAQARFDRWLDEARWVLEHHDRLQVASKLVEALKEETRPRSWGPVRLPRGGYRGRASAGGEARPWEQAASRALRQVGLSREDAEAIRRCCGLMERARRVHGPR
jgi:hypothetical protein